MDPNKQIRYSHYQIQDKVQFGGLMDPDQCKTLAKKILSLYDSNGDGYIDSFEVGYMLSDVYRAMNKGFNPTPTDIASYTRVLDRKGTGKVHQEDIEQLCMKYFSGQFTGGSGSQQPVGPGLQTGSSYYDQKNRLSKLAQDKLDGARRIFKKLDRNRGYLTEQEVPELLRETYKNMGMNYEPTQEDIQMWIKMTDSDNDGRVTLDDYEQLVLKNLKQQGIE